MRSKPRRMPKAQRDRLKVGDRIKVRTWDREGYHTIVRKIVSIDSRGMIGITFNGWKPFYLAFKDDIIIEKVNNLSLKARAVGGIRSYNSHIKAKQ